MLDSVLEPSYHLSKNLSLLPWIQKLIVYMVNDSTPLEKHDTKGVMRGEGHVIMKKEKVKVKTYVNCDMMFESGQPLSSTSSTVELRSEKLKQRFTRIPYRPSGLEMCALE